MQYVADAFDDPKDALAFQCIFPSLPKTSELFADLSEEYGQTTAMRGRDAWTHMILFNPPVTSIPYFGQRLRILDVRCDQAVSLFFTEFLPALEDLRIAAPRFSGGIRAPIPKLKHLSIISSGLFGLFSNTHETLPMLESLTIYTTILHGASGVQFPPKLQRLYLSGLLMFHVVDAMASCRAKDVSLVCGGLLDIPDLPPTVERLDVSHNLIGSYGSDRFPRLRELNVHNNFLFDSTSILGDSIEVLDIRGTSGWPFYLRNAHTVHTSTDPPSHMTVSCPNIKRVFIHDADTTEHAWHMHAFMMADHVPEETAQTEGWRSYIDDVDIIYQFGTRYEARGGND